MNSSNSVVTPVTMANTACYDPVAHCIRLPAASSDAGAILEGSIIELETPASPPGKLLMGEIVEIVVMDENMQPLAVHNKETEGAPSAKKPSMQDELLRMQREQRELHEQQSQELRQKHEHEKRQMSALQREGKLSSHGGAQLTADMEDTHRREVAELRQSQQSDESELMDLIAENGGKPGPEPQKQQAASPKAADRWSRAAVATVAGRAIHQSKSAGEEKEPVPPAPQSPKRSAANLWNKAAVATVSAGAMNQKPKASAAKEPPQPTAASISNAMDPETRKKQHRQEIQAVMKDKTLGREEKQKRLAEIKAKYAAPAHSQAAAAAPAKPSAASRWNKAAVSTVSANALGSLGTKPAPKPEPEPPKESSKPMAKTASSRWKRGAAAALGSKALGSKFKDLKQAEGSNTPMSEFIAKLKGNSPSLTTIVLDGRKDVTADEWGRLFDALEDNGILTHLSLADCDLDDNVATPLVLALVENETITTLNLSDNKELSSSTGKSLVKVLKQSNPILKEVKIDGTGISSKVAKKLQDILDDRDDVKKLEKLQAQRQMKIKALLAFSASDEATPSAQRLSQKMLDVEKESDDAGGTGHVSTGHSARSGSTSSSRGKDKSKKKTPKKNRRASVESNPGSTGGTGSAQRRSGAHRGSNRSSPHSSATSGGSAGAKFRRAAHASAMAAQMANLSADVMSGKSMEELKASRKMRGECETCGVKCFTKTMFKTIPLTVPDKVLEGRCLQCAPFGSPEVLRRRSSDVT